MGIATHTLPLMDLACTTLSNTLVSMSAPTLTPPQEAPPRPRLLLPNNQSLSPLRPTKLSSNFTPLVSSIALLVELTLTTLLPLLDTVPKLDKTTSSSETHGEPHGESKDT